MFSNNDFTQLDYYVEFEITDSLAPQPAQYTVAVSANPSNGGLVSGGGTYDENTSRTVTATAYSGYRFVNWTENGSEVSGSANYTFTLTANRNLTANFEYMGGGPNPTIDYYTLTVSNGIDKTNTGPYSVGTRVNIQADNPPAGKVFDKWVTDNGGSFGNTNSASTTFTMPAGNVTVTATYKDSGIDPDIPKTGDTGNMMGWWIVLLSSVLGVLCMMVWRKWRQLKGTW
jgi:hypothetical protein